MLYKESGYSWREVKQRRHFLLSCGLSSPHHLFIFFISLMLFPSFLTLFMLFLSFTIIHYVFPTFLLSFFPPCLPWLPPFLPITTILPLFPPSRTQGSKYLININFLPFITTFFYPSMCHLLHPGTVNTSPSVTNFTLTPLRLLCHQPHLFSFRLHYAPLTLP